MPESTATRRQPQTSDALRDDVRAAISNAYYDARNTGRTMEHAADDAADRAVEVLTSRPLAVLAEMERHAPLPNPVGFYAAKLRAALGVEGPLQCTCASCGGA